METMENKEKKTSKPYDRKQEMSELIEAIDLQPLQKQFMKSRWLDQVMWLEKRSKECRNKYYFLRMITIVGGVIVPALVSMNIGANNIQAIFGWIAFGLSQTVAISAAVEEFFHYGELYRQYRNTAELMKMEGWYFLQLSGRYQDFETHEDAYRTFASRVEKMIEQDLQVFTQMGQEQQKSEEQSSKSDGYQLKAKNQSSVISDQSSVSH